MLFALLIWISIQLSSNYVSGGSPFMELYPTEVKSSQPACADSGQISCYPAKVNIGVLQDTSISLSLESNITLVKKNGIDTGGDSTSVAFTNEEDERDQCVFTFRLDHLFASCFIQSRYYVIRNCGDDCHIWIEVDTGTLPDSDDGMTIPGHATLPDSNDGMTIRSNATIPKLHAKLSSSSQDQTSVVTYSIMFYYTQPFKDKVGDVSTWIDQAIAVTNQGYINSQMPIRATKGCAELSRLQENKDSSQMLMALTYSKNTTAAILRSFDVAALLVDKLSSCGVAWYDSIQAGSPFVVAKESCVLGYFSLGHEIGHTFGAKHNPEITTNLEYPAGHAHLIEKGGAKTGARTILAYNANGHFQRVNYYSNPDVIYPTTGTATGREGVSNNAEVIVGNRFAMAALGDESEIDSCDAGSPGSGSSGSGGGTTSCAEHYCKLGQDHTMCKYQHPEPKCDIKTSGFGFQQVIAAIVDKHNDLRRKVAKGEEARGPLGPQPKASNMKKLVWDEELAAIAQRWTDQCAYGTDDNRKVERFDWVGQNGLWRSSQDDFTLDATVAVQKWYDEVARFPGTVAPFNQSGSTGVTRHYSQLAWADTDLVGCGITKYYRKDSQNKYNILVFCNYGVGGNRENRDMYKVGEAGFQCPEGYSPLDGLCASDSPYQAGHLCEQEVHVTGGGITQGPGEVTQGHVINITIPAGPGWAIPQISGKIFKAKPTVCAHPVNLRAKFRKSKVCKDNSGKEYTERKSVENCCYIYTCVKSGRKDLKWKFEFLSKNCCKYLGKIYLSGQNILSENMDQCSARVITCQKGEDGKSSPTTELRHGNCCSYDSKVYPVGSALPLLESCSQLTCHEGTTGPTFHMDRIFGTSGCCWHQGNMVQDGGQVMLEGTLATCCRGKLVAPVQ